MAKSLLKNPTQLIQLGLTALLIAAAFFIGSMWSELKVLKSGQQPTVAGQPAAQPEAVTELTDAQWQQVLDKPAASWGDESAPVTMVEFTDYQCPFCARHFTDTAGLIDADYIDTGKVRYLVRDLPLPFHPNAQPAAEAARCAGDQGKYRAYHDLLFEKQDAWINLPDPATTLKGYASQLGLNAGEFATCYDSGKYAAAVEGDAALAAQVGATGTPTFIINGQVVVGAQAYAVFQSTIDEALN
jgi:protein-disulfide isomerase